MINMSEMICIDDRWPKMLKNLIVTWKQMFFFFLVYSFKTTIFPKLELKTHFSSKHVVILSMALQTTLQPPQVSDFLLKHMLTSQLGCNKGEWNRVRGAQSTAKITFKYWTRLSRKSGVGSSSYSGLLALILITWEAKQLICKTT